MQKLLLLMKRLYIHILIIKKEMEYGADNRYILKEKIADYESIKYVLKL